MGKYVEVEVTTYSDIERRYIRTYYDGYSVLLTESERAKIDNETGPFSEQMANLKQATDEFKAAIGAPFLPILESLVSATNAFLIGETGPEFVVPAKIASKEKGIDEINNDVSDDWYKWGKYAE